MRLKRGPAFYIGACFALITLLLIVLAARNLYGYFSMRSAEVRVLASSMKIDIFPAPDSDSVPYLGYLLRLSLETTDTPARNISWEVEAGKAAYPEEALDELRAWAPGTLHRIHFLRNNPRAIRIEALERSSELESGIGSVVASILFGMITLFCFTAVSLSGQENDPQASPWYLFVAFGLLPLLGWVVFTGSFIWKLSTWEAVSVEVPEQTTTFNTAAPPAGVEITPAAVEKLKDNTYRLFTFSWNGETRSGAVGTLGGEFDDPNNYFRFGPGRLNFHISPKNRWAVAVNLGEGQDFWVPFLALLGFGVVFTGAGLMVRSMSQAPKVKLRR